MIRKVLKRSPDSNQTGQLEPGQKLRLAQSGLIDGMTAAASGAKPGANQRLVLEAYDNHPEKLDELETSNSLAEDFDLPLLYEPQP